MNSLKKGEGVPLLNFEGGPGILLLSFEVCPGVPLLNFEGSPGSQVPGSRGPGSTFTPCRKLQYKNAGDEGAHLPQS